MNKPHLFHKWSPWSKMKFMLWGRTCATCGKTATVEQWYL